jgi:hypothetical protein
MQVFLPSSSKSREDYCAGNHEGYLTAPSVTSPSATHFSDNIVRVGLNYQFH